MEVRWTVPAADDLERIARYIQQDDPRAARRVAESLYARAMSLGAMPERGRPGRIAGTRDLVQRPYIIVYRITADIVEVLRIYHGAQNWP
ncbi:MAG TPA: type II toxin-antitoxin system RelE/ParE family toxin [Stellaceae bacterium]|nr:type II toxin-antitoxin system RelE/ParE family toxin [Stellaceae bacterium]